MGEARSVKLRYTRKAAAELSEVLDYIAERSPVGERSVAHRLQDMLALIEQYPEIGRPLSRGHLRRLALTPYPYLIFYRITRDGPVIHGVRHSARKPLQA